MDRTSPAAHAGHDELLVARLFGDDVSDAERTAALRLVSECPECESIFADLGAIAEATSALPVPPRPRDFSLTEADAARLGKHVRGRWRLLGLGLRRSLGGSLAALGIVGVILTGTSSVLGGAASTADNRFAASQEMTAGPVAVGAVPAASAAGGAPQLNPAGGPTAAPASTPAPAATAASAVPVTAAPPAVPNPSPLSTVAFPVTNVDSTFAPPASFLAGSGATASSTAHDIAAASPVTPQGVIDNSGATKSAEAASGGSGGIDLRLAGLIVSAAVFLLGLGLAVLPVRRRARDRSARP